jgi:hypothetical protein
MEVTSPLIKRESEQTFPSGAAKGPCDESSGAKITGSSSSAVAVVTSQNLDLSIVTGEGDRITLHSDSSTAEAYATYSGTLAQATTQVRASASSLSVSVEGNLSRYELKDVSKALQAYAKVLRDVLSGNTRPAQAHAAQIGRLDGIASFDATFTSKQSISAQAQSVSDAS